MQKELGTRDSGTSPFGTEHDTIFCHHLSVLAHQTHTQRTFCTRLCSACFDFLPLATAWITYFAHYFWGFSIECTALACFVWSTCLLAGDLRRFLSATELHELNTCLRSTFYKSQ